jgi:hypothetical protein
MLGGGFNDIDDRRQCPQCFGRGKIPATETSPPDVDPDLVKKLQDVWNEYHRGK